MNRIVFILVCSFSLFIQAVGLVIPTFKVNEDDHTDVKLRGEQFYPEERMKDILWQLEFWVGNKGPSTEQMKYVVTDILQHYSKDTGFVSLDCKKYQLLHWSRGHERNSATLFFIPIQGGYQIVGIGQHRKTERMKSPEYDIVAWDERFTTPLTTGSILVLK